MAMPLCVLYCSAGRLSSARLGPGQGVSATAWGLDLDIRQCAILLLRFVSSPYYSRLLFMIGGSQTKAGGRLVTLPAKVTTSIPRHVLVVGVGGGGWTGL